MVIASPFAGVSDGCSPVARPGSHPTRYGGAIQMITSFWDIPTTQRQFRAPATQCWDAGVHNPFGLVKVHYPSRGSQEIPGGGGTMTRVQAPTHARSRVTGEDGRHHSATFIENGHVQDELEKNFKTGLREITKVHKGEFKLTANWLSLNHSGLRLSSSACVALPMSLSVGIKVQCSSIPHVRLSGYLYIHLPTSQRICLITPVLECYKATLRQSRPTSPSIHTP